MRNPTLRESGTKALASAAAIAFLLAACNAKESPAPAAQPAAPQAAPAAAEVGPDGPADLAIPAIAAIPSDEASIKKGEAVWAARGCGGCHQFGAKLVGPDLVGITQRRPLPWIERMVLHPGEMVKRDPVAKGLFRTLMVEMPNQAVPADDLPPLLAYIKSKGG